MTKRQFIKEHGEKVYRDLLDCERVYVVEKILKRDDIRNELKLFKIKVFMNGWLKVKDVL